MHNEAVPFRNALLFHFKEFPESCQVVEMFPGVVEGTKDVYSKPSNVEKIAPSCTDN